MDLHLLELFRRQALPGFEMMYSGTASFPMSWRTAAARSASRSSSPRLQFPADFRGVDLHAAKVVVSRVVLGLDRKGQGFDRPHVQIRKRFGMDARIFSPCQMQAVCAVEQERHGQDQQRDLPAGVSRSRMKRACHRGAQSV